MNLTDEAIENLKKRFSIDEISWNLIILVLFGILGQGYRGSSSFSN